ncbi:MAG: phage portal protein [Pseudoclavibacter sp.]|nr:phage portal protein [Pseudoclavibacter sp.]
MAFAVSQGALRHLAITPAPAPAALTLAAGHTEAYAGLFRSQRAVQTVVSALARHIAQLRIHLYRRNDDTDRKRITDHDLARLLAAPSRSRSRYWWMYSLVADLAIYDRCYAVKVNRPDGPELVRLPPARVQAVGGDWEYPAAFKIGNTQIPAEHVLFIRGYSPDASHDGCSPLESLRRVLAEDHQAAQSREQLYTNGTRVSGYIERPVNAPKWSPAARDRFGESWRAQYTGDGSRPGGTPVLDDGMVFKPASMSAVDMQYIESRKLTREEVAAAYHIPPPMVGILEQATFSNIREQHVMLYQDTLGPWLQMLQEELTRGLLPWIAPDEQDLYLEFNIAEKLRGSFEQQAQQLFQATGRPYMTSNEARARLNLPRIEGGDELVTPLNMLLGDTGGDPLDPKGGRPRLKSAARDRRNQAAAAALRGFFRRQRAAVLAAVKTPDWWNDNWDRELQEIILDLTLTASTARGRAVARSLGFTAGDYDADATIAYLDAAAAGTAEAINTRTRGLLVDALADETDPAHVFDVAESSRAAQLGVGLMTAATGFAVHEAAQQLRGNRRIVKRWVTGPNPRPSHAAMDGETAPLDGQFSNGAMWPGSGNLDADESAGCNCDMHVTWE